MCPGGIAIVPLLLGVCWPGSRPMLAEVFYDALGDDSGLEYVELWNPTADAYSLLGLRIEAGDGSTPGRWTLRWTGQSGDTIRARGRFVIGGTRVVPAPQALAALELQNGPDAVRLVWPDGNSEVVGYGTQEFPEYSCGDPAADAPSGLSLARVPDDSNRGSNALDFRSSAPSPGRANLSEHDVGWVAGSLVLAPEQPGTGSAATLEGRLVNLGKDALSPGAIGVRIESRSGVDERVLFEAPLASGLAPGDSAGFEATLPGLPDGKQDLLVRLTLRDDENAANDVDSLRVRVGPGPWEATEIQFHPAAGEGEWIELRNRSSMPLDPALFTLSDRGTTRGRPSGGGHPCEPESLILLAQSRAALLGRFPGLDSGRIWQTTPWPALNNTDDTSGTADAVVLRETDGTLCSRDAYSAAGVPAGVSIERREGGFWSAALDGAGSPLAPPRSLPPLAGALGVSPRRIRSGAGSARISWSLPWARASVVVDAYDLAGSLVAHVLPERAAAGRGEATWSAEDLAPGLYVLVLRARAVPGGESLTATRGLRIDGVSP